MPPANYKIILDFPSDSPALGFDQTAAALKDIIEGSRPQFAVGIFGTWGSGKTTLMHAIARLLDPDTTIPVQFSAWRYEREPHLIVPLLDTVRDALIQWAHSKKNKNSKAEALKTASTVGKAIYSVLAGLSFKVGMPHALEVSFEANKALAQADSFWEKEKDAKVSRSFYHAAFKALHDSFAEFLGTESKRRIVVFVDDLDRCLPQGALEVLETMKLFFDLEGFVFVVGLDQSVVERSIDIKYRSDGPAGTPADGSYQIRGADYIKKIFQLPYTIAPVAVTQLNEFLDAVYAEAKLPQEQEQELRTVVTPHLQFLVTESGVNPREIKRYLNAYTLVSKIKPHLEKNVVLALQTIRFRRDWEVASRALLSYREVFTDAVKRQLANDSTALRDLDQTLAGTPESFMSYVSQGSPGNALLTTQNLAEYIYTGEAATSSRGTVFIDAIRDVAQLTKQLRACEAAPIMQDANYLGQYASSVNSVVGKMKDLSLGRLGPTLQDWSDHVNQQAPYAPNTPREDAEPLKKRWIAEEDAIRRRVLNQLMELYQNSGQSAAAVA